MTTAASLVLTLPTRVPRIGDLEIVRPGRGVEVVAPTGVIRGPDDRVWFTSIGNDRLGRVDPGSKRIEVFADPAGVGRLPANIYPGIKDGPDGWLWFTDKAVNALGRIYAGRSDRRD